MSENKGVLASERGSTTISEGVVTVIAGMAARQVEGLRMGSGGRRLAGDNSPTVGEFLSGFGVGGQSASRGVFVEVDGGTARVEVHVEAEYGTPVPGLVAAVREGVIRQLETLTGLTVSEVNVTVSDVVLPDAQQS